MLFNELFLIKNCESPLIERVEAERGFIKELKNFGSPWSFDVRPPTARISRFESFRRNYRFSLIYLFLLLRSTARKFSHTREQLSSHFLEQWKARKRRKITHLQIAQERTDFENGVRLLIRISVFNSFRLKPAEASRQAQSIYANFHRPNDGKRWEKRWIYINW